MNRWRTNYRETVSSKNVCVLLCSVALLCLCFSVACFICGSKAARRMICGGRLVVVRPGDYRTAYSAMNGAWSERFVPCTQAAVGIRRQLPS
jgi:hypothetical protein